MDGVTGSKNQDAVEALPEPQTSLKEGRPKLTVTLNWRRTQGCRPHSHTMQGAWAYPSDCFKVSYSTDEMKTVGGCSSNQNWPKPEWSKIGSGRGFCVCADEQRRSRESGGPDGDPAHLPVPRREEGSYKWFPNCSPEKRGAATAEIIQHSSQTSLLNVDRADGCQVYRKHTQNQRRHYAFTRRVLKTGAASRMQEIDRGD